MELADGDTFELRIAPVAKRIGDDTVRMIAYNGSIPGPTLRVREGSELVVDVVNEGDLEATVHWHGLRLENRYDGTHETQAPIPVGGRFSYRISFPDPGVYWYHPHIREDYGQELGQYGNILVDPAEPDYWPPAHRELLLTLDDIFIEGGEIAPFSRDETTFAAMGRYGNVMLVAGETAPSFAVQQGEVVRLYLTNTANTRVFNVALPGARMKLVGGDSGRVEREELVESVVLAPSERVVVDVLFGEPGQTALEHRTPERTYTLATFDVAAEPATPSLADEFAVLRVNPEWAAERQRLEAYVDAPPGQDARVRRGDGHGRARGRRHLRLPDASRGRGRGVRALSQVRHEARRGRGPGDVRVPDAPRGRERAARPLPEVRHEAGRRVARHGVESRARAPRSRPRGARARGAGARRHALTRSRPRTSTITRTKATTTTTRAGSSGRTTCSSSTAGRRPRTCAGCSSTATRARPTTTSRGSSPSATASSCGWSTRWTRTIRCTTRSTFTARAASSSSPATACPETNYVWKDTVLVRTGETVDILLDVTNPGRWMAHCHIAEHHESGMMFSFDVAPAAASSA